jgi:predicted peroxiredoxin
MDKKVAIFAFSEEFMCFTHALMNALDMHARGYDVKLIIEGGATRLIKEFAEPGKPFYNRYVKAREAGLIDCVCEACANMTETVGYARGQGLAICNEMMGHPGMGKYIDAGYRVVVF